MEYFFEWRHSLLKRKLRDRYRRHHRLPDGAQPVPAGDAHRTYSVNEIGVKEGDWLAGKRLRDCRLPEEGVTVLGIYRADGIYLGVPRADTNIYAGDTLVLYGRADDLRELTFRRDDPSGQKAHEKAVDDQKSHEDRQARQYRRKKERQTEKSETRKAASGG